MLSGNRRNSKNNEPVTEKNVLPIPPRREALKTFFTSAIEVCLKIPLWLPTTKKEHNYISNTPMNEWGRNTLWASSN